MLECLLCLQTDQDITCSIQVNSPEWIENDIKELIDKHLWPMDSIKDTSWLCILCWQELKDFHKFYKRIEEVHNNYIESILKIDTDPLEEDKKPKDMELELLLEPEIVFGHGIEPAILIKQETEEVINTEICIGSKIQEDTENYSILNRNEKPFKNSNCVDNESDVSDEDLPLMQRMKIEKDTKENIKHNSDESSSDSQSDPLQPIGRRKKKNLKEKDSNANKNKSYYTPRTNRLEHDKFLQEHFKITCNICNLPFQTFPLLCKHYTGEHNERGFVTCCQMKFYDRSHLVHHIKYHLDPEYFKCKECGKISNSLRGFQRHMETHKEKRFQCDICDKKFREKFKLEYHKKVHLPAAKKKHPCQECGKFFASETILITHQRVVHLGVYAKVCELCGVTMPDTSSFKIHMKKHEDNSFQVSCPECGLILAGPLQLKRHCDIRHPADGKREYKCHICPKISPSLRALKKHIRCAHEMGYDFKCTICDKAFKRADNLKSHMFTHSDTHRYRCQWCPKTFNSDGNMYNHRKKAHPVEWEEAQRKKYSGNLPPNFKPPERVVTSENPV